MNPQVPDVLSRLLSAGCTYRGDPDHLGRWWAHCPRCRTTGRTLRVVELPSSDAGARCEARGCTLADVLDAIDATVDTRLQTYDAIVDENARLRRALTSLRGHLTVLDEIHHGPAGEASGARS